MCACVCVCCACPQYRDTIDATSKTLKIMESRPGYKSQRLSTRPTNASSYMLLFYF